jgi:mannose-6-phosphate isomerase-like protein (cupin superfamily)
MDKNFLEFVQFGNVMYGIIVRSEFKKEDIHFFSPPEFSQQLAYMNHPAGKIIEPHVHNPVPREVHYTQEALFIRKGRLRVDFYDEDHSYLESRELGAGDVILLAGGGHGFEVLEEIEMIEVKQGPYAGDADKTRFSGVQKSQIRLPESEV